MGWVCKYCSTNNEDSNSKCIVCDRPKNTSVVRTLTAKRVKELGLTGNVVIPLEFNVIGECAFLKRTDIISVTFHDGLKRISEMAFAGCKNLRRVIKTKQLTYIGPKAFYDCSSLTKENRPRAKKISEDAFGFTPVKTLPTASRSVKTYEPYRYTAPKRRSSYPTGVRVFVIFILILLSGMITVPIIYWLISLLF